MPTSRKWAMWGVLALLGACNTFDDAPPESGPQGLPTVTPPSSTFPGFGPVSAGAAVVAIAGTPAFGAAGAAGMVMRWQPIDAGAPPVDADGGEEDAGVARPLPR
jgi:hypothetical protein